jgi:hypothetical protein
MYIGDGTVCFVKVGGVHCLLLKKFFIVASHEYAVSAAFIISVKSSLDIDRLGAWTHDVG